MPLFSYVTMFGARRAMGYGLLLTDGRRGSRISTSLGAVSEIVGALGLLRQIIKDQSQRAPIRRCRESGSVPDPFIY